MKRFSSVLLVLGLSLLLTSMMWGQAFNIHVIATDGVMTDSLILGNDAVATDGIDAGLGEIEQPPVPITGTFDVRSANFGSHNIGQGLKTDYRPYAYLTQSDTFRVNWQTSTEGTTTLHLSWPAGLASVGGGWWKLVDRVGGTDMNVDMTAVTSYDVPATVTSFYIIYGDGMKFQTVSYFRIGHELNSKNKIFGANKPDGKKAPNVLPNLATLAFQLDKDAALKAQKFLFKVGSDPVKHVFINKYNSIQKSAYTLKTNEIHLATNLYCLDSAYNLKYKKAKDGTLYPAPIVKLLKGMVPTTLKSAQNNGFFAELMTLHLNVLLSDKNITPVGLKNLVIKSGTFAGQTIATFMANADNVMSCVGVGSKDVATFDQYRAQCKAINEGFIRAYPDSGYSTTSVAKFDTVVDGTHFWLQPKYKGQFWVKGVKTITEAGFLRGAGMGADVAAQMVVESAQPEQYSLDQNYPNPFNPTTQIAFNLADEGFVTVKVFNMLGQEIATLVNNEQMPAGQSAVEFDASSHASGVYFYRVSVNDEAGAMKFSAVKKMMLVK